MKVNKEKCTAWSNLCLTLLQMTKELTDEEYRYIKANFSIAFGNLELKELEDKSKETSTKVKKGA